MAPVPPQISKTFMSPKVEMQQPLVIGATRIKSEDLFRDQREIEIEHQGRIYRLRVTQLNKLILTA